MSMLSMDFSVFEDFAEKIDRAGGDLKSVVDDAMQQVAETVQADTLEAVSAHNLPAKGKYSNGDTARSVIRESDVRVEWSGNIAEVGLGFDFSKPGAGGFLIHGTPKMAPDGALQDIFMRQKYKSQLIRDMMDIFMDALVDIGGGQ